MKVSIVVNNYNYGCFLRQAIDSALSQSYEDVEVVVVDDGSTDDSKDVIASYGERILPLVKENGGQASAFNAGFAACAGDVVIFLDADDMLFPSAAERVISAWRPSVSHVQYRLEIIDTAGNRQGKLHCSGPMPSGDLRSRILSIGSYPHSPTSGNAFARHCLEHLMPMPEDPWRIGADGYLLQLSPFLGDVTSLDEVLGLYRVHDSNQFAATTFDLKKVETYLALDVKKQEALSRHLTGSTAGSDQALLHRLSHVKVRIASLRMAPDMHPFPSDTLSFLAKRGIALTWSNSFVGLPQKLLVTIWFVLAVLLPGSFARRLFVLAMTPHTRAGWLRAVFG